MKLINAQYMRFFDDDLGQSVIVPVQAVNHCTKTRRGKEFTPVCGKCSSTNLIPIETHIQHGMLADKHWFYVYCADCKTVTVHHYEVSDNGD